MCSFNGTPILIKDGNVKYLKLSISVSATITKNTWYSFCAISNEEFAPMYGYQNITTIYSGVDAVIRYNYDYNMFQFYAYSDIVTGASYAVTLVYI